MATDPFDPPAAALARPAGHVLTAARNKMAALHPPTAATGVPLGGVGTGGITRSSDGRFSRWSLKAGHVRDFCLPANGFLIWCRPAGGAATARALQPRPRTAELTAYEFEPASPAWHGLYPVAWHAHAPLGGVSARCLSFSPVTRGDEAACALPLAVFVWRVENTGAAHAEASVAFTFANMNGWFADWADGRPARPAAGSFNRDMAPDAGAGVVLDRRRPGDDCSEGTGEWAIAVTANGDARFARTVCFDGAGDGAALWTPYSATGDVPDLGPGWVVESGFREVAPALPTAAVSARVALPPGARREITFSLVWDLPVIGFGQGRTWHRAYCDAWGTSGRAAPALTRHAHAHARRWADRLAADHRTDMRELGGTPHRAGAVINAAHFLTDGLSVWTSARGSPDGRAHFGLIECPDYALYNTLDLWIYATDTVARILPGAAAGVVTDFVQMLDAADPAARRERWDGTLFPLNPAGVCPHDLGGPLEDPFVTPNGYTHRNPTTWKDLNADLVLCVWRAGQWMGSAWRALHLPQVRRAIEHLRQFDRDGDGLIENDGSPDQTFDNIPMRGPSSYCGGLWIAALRAAARIAVEAGDGELARTWSTLADRAATSFRRKLFNGRYFRVDTTGPLSEACFIEQLFGPFLARRYGLGDIVAPADARTALATVFETNFLDEGGGEGAVTLARIPQGAANALPHRADTSFQTAEIQPGFNFSLAAQLDTWGLHDEAERLLVALHEQLHGQRNLSFQFPAAFDRGRDTCRAILNMRPMAAGWLRGSNHSRQFGQEHSSSL